jgi:hypothetical protein
MLSVGLLSRAQELNRLVELHKMLEGPGGADDLDGPPMNGGGMIGDGTDAEGTAHAKHSTLEALANGTIPVNSYISGEGFGNPLTKPPSVLALQVSLGCGDMKTWSLSCQYSVAFVTMASHSSFPSTPMLVLRTCYSGRMQGQGTC